MSALKQERFSARIPAEEKRSLERAAELSGRNLTDFVMAAAHQAAVSTFQRYEGMILANPKDKKLFFETMMSPPSPNAKLRAAAARYLEATKHHDE